MRVILIFISYLLVYESHAQYNQQEEYADAATSANYHHKNIINYKDSTHASIDSALQKAIQKADGTYSLSDLTAIVYDCLQYCNTSPGISLSLTKWLREDNPVYDKRSPIESNQFRAFLLASLAHFPPNEEIYKYVKSELLFADHTINIAAATATARNFKDKAAELIPLMEPYLSSGFNDETVDVTTPELNYPVANPTKARYEILQTLTAFGAASYRSLDLINQIIDCKNCAVYGRDSVLYEKALQAATYILNVTPECCRKKDSLTASSHGLLVINEQDRSLVSANSIKLVDEESDSLYFAELTGHPFVLTFFYTQCTNALKCVSTVQRLSKLEENCIKNSLADKIGIYGMTYDPDFDSPSILKKYGEMYGLKFNTNTKFLKSANNSNTLLTNQLHVRVNYGAGTINQHGIQLFIFDKKGRLAAICDNDSWSVNDVEKILSGLINE